MGQVYHLQKCLKPRHRNFWRVGHSENRQNFPSKQIPLFILPLFFLRENIEARLAAQDKPSFLATAHCLNNNCAP